MKSPKMAKPYVSIYHEIKYHELLNIPAVVQLPTLMFGVLDYNNSKINTWNTLYFEILRRKD